MSCGLSSTSKCARSRSHHLGEHGACHEDTAGRLAAAHGRAPHAQEPREAAHRLALGAQGVDHGLRVGPAQRHAAHHHLLRGQLQLLGDEAVELREGGLRAGVQAARARGHHDVLQEHAVVQPAALLHDAVDGEDQAHRGVEEGVVAAVLRVHARLVGLADAQQAVQVPAHLAAAVDVGAAPLHGVVGVLLGVRGTLDGVVVGGAQRWRASASRACPVSTCTFQGWVLVPEGARAATARMSSTVSRGTGVGR
jgi:hypothetical protein